MKYSFPEKLPNWALYSPHTRQCQTMNKMNHTHLVTTSRVFCADAVVKSNSYLAWNTHNRTVISWNSPNSELLSFKTTSFNVGIWKTRRAIQDQRMQTLIPYIYIYIYSLPKISHHSACGAPNTRPCWAIPWHNADYANRHVLFMPGLVVVDIEPM